MRGIILKTILLFSFITCTNLYAVREVAITIDDLPIAYHGGYLNSSEEIEYFHKILDILDEYDIKVFGFAVGQYITEYKWELLEEFIVRGHVLGNHTYSHPDLNRVSCANYIEDIKKGESVIFDLMGDIMYFRYPMLHRGNSSEKRDSIYTFLNESDYVIVPVSIDNDEFLYNKNYIEAIANDNFTLADEIGSLYIEHIVERSNYFDSLAYQIEKRHIRHILLLHMNYLNSIYLDDILNWYLENEWEIISVEQALQDPLYYREDIYIGNKGLSFIERVQGGQ